MLTGLEVLKLISEGAKPEDFEIQDFEYWDTLSRDNSINFMWRTNKKFRKKTRMCSLAGIEFPEPLKEAPRLDGEYWEFNIMFLTVTKCYWSYTVREKSQLEAGLLHATKEGAELHLKALLAANKEAVGL